jgi:hypothetical protein
VNWLCAEGWPSTAEVVISYASGRRVGRDCDGAGPGMYYAVGILGLLHERGLRCFSGLHVPPGADWEVFMLRLNSRFAQAKVLIVVLTAALFESKPCLKEIEAVEKGFFGATNSRHDFALWR